MKYDRRKFISFLGKAGLGAVIMPQFLMSCGNTTTPTKGFSTISKERLKELRRLVLDGLNPSDKDDLLLANGLNYHTIIKWGDKISDTDVCSQIKLNFFAQNLREVSANLVKNFDTVFF